MRLPVNPILYLASAGLLGLAGYTFYESMQLGSQPVRTEHTDRGAKEAQDLLARGKSQGPTQDSWVYNTAAWKSRFLAPNLIAKPPKVDLPKDPTEQAVQEQPRDLRPLSEIIELVSLMCDTSTGGKGGQSHVIVRYKDGVDVQVPTWYQLENQPPSAVAASPGPADSVGGRPRPGSPRPIPGRPPAQVPMSSAGQEIVQRVWVAGDGTPRFEATLWPPFDDIRLLEVKADALSAVFSRAPAAAPKPVDGEPPPEQKPVEEELFKSSFDISPDIMRTVRDLLGGEALRRPEDSAQAPAESSGWQDVEETRMVNGTVHISRKDQQRINEEPEAFLNRINVDSYRSSTGSGLRGLRVMNVSPEISQRFGVMQNDVIVSVNGEEVSTKADAIATGKRLYKRGVRTFVVKFLSDGRFVERTYQAPDR